MGMGYPASWAKNAAQRKQSALLAAELDAKRNLAEWLSGVDIEAVTVVTEGVVTQDEIRQSVQAHLERVQILSQIYDEKSGQATVELILELSQNTP